MIHPSIHPNLRSYFEYKTSQRNSYPGLSFRYMSSVQLRTQVIPTCAQPLTTVVLFDVPVR